MRPLSDHQVDPRQLSALLRLYRWLGFRAARDSRTGRKKGGPLLIVPSYLVFGGLLIPTLQAAAEARTALIMLATAVLGMSALTLIPDALETQQGRLEVLSTKPVGEWTMAVAQLLTNLRGLSLIVASLALPGLIFIQRTMDVPIPTLLVFALLTLLAALSLQLLWLSVLLALATRLSYEQVRTTAQAMLMTVLLTSWLPGLIFRTLREEGGSASFAGVPGLAALPSSWVVDAYGQSSGPAAWPPRLLLFGLLVTALSLRAFTASRRHQRRLFEIILQPAPKVGRPPLEVRLLSALIRLRWVRGPRVGVARLILLALEREDHARLRRMSLRVLMVLNLVAAYLLGLPLMAGIPTGTLAAMLLATELDLYQDSHHAQAAWIFEAAPIDPGELRAGARLALLVSFWSFSGPLLVLGVLPNLPPLTAALWFLALFLGAYVLLSFALALQAPRPLAREPRGGFHLKTLFIAFGFGTLGGLAQAAFEFGPFVVVALLLLLAGLAARRHGPGPHPGRSAPPPLAPG